MSANRIDPGGVAAPAATPPGSGSMGDRFPRVARRASRPGANGCDPCGVKTGGLMAATPAGSKPVNDFGTAGAVVCDKKPLAGEVDAHACLWGIAMIDRREFVRRGAIAAAVFG